MKIKIVAALLAVSVFAVSVPVNAKGGNVRQSPCMTEFNTARCPAR